MTNYYHNESIYCSQCSKLRYMGSTNKPDSELCTCADQDNIPTIIKYKAFKTMTPEERFQKWLTSIEPNMPYGLDKINESIKELENILEEVKDNPPPILIHFLEGERKKKRILESQEDNE